MFGQTKMIILTSNEDLIRQLSLKKTTNTQIIDLDNDQQVASIIKDNNIINLTLLAELSQLSSNNDQVYKRALDSPHNNQSKSAKISKKSDYLICTICGDYAIGFNYDALSCASCKSFFRRNAAHQYSKKIKCLKGDGQCSVAHEVHRKCSRCRLDRCFAMGMRKDFIRSEEEKQQRKKQIEENRNISLKRLSTSESTNSSSTSQSVPSFESFSQTFDEIDRLFMDMDKDNDNTILLENTDLNEIGDTSMKPLSAEDSVIVETVRSSFLSFFPIPTEQCTNALDLSDRASALISCSEFINETALRFIGFFRQIDEFEGLDGDDRFILIKYNLLPLFSINKCFYYRPNNDCCSCEENEETERSRRFFMLCGGSNTIPETFMNLVVSLVEITEQDPALLSLLLIILLFSQGLSMSEDEPSLKDSLAINRAQSYYTQILWNYLVNKQGERKTWKQFTQLLTIIFRIQSTTKNLREFFCVQFRTSDIINRIAPLMQSVMHIS